jgi:hypothetical protein
LEEGTVAFDIGTRIGSAIEPIYDIVLPPTPTIRAAGLADVAPAAGLDLAVVGGLAAAVAAVLVIILHRRRR